MSPLLLDKFPDLRDHFSFLVTRRVWQVFYHITCYRNPKLGGYHVMSTIINSGVFDDGFFKKGFKNCDCNHNCNCGRNNNCCPPNNIRLQCFCSDRINAFFTTGTTVRVVGTGGTLYTGTITSVQCDFFTLTLTLPTTIVNGTTTTTIPAGTVVTIPCASVESISPAV